MRFQIAHASTFVGLALGDPSACNTTSIQSIFTESSLVTDLNACGQYDDREAVLDCFSAITDSSNSTCGACVVSALTANMTTCLTSCDFAAGDCADCVEAGMVAVLPACLAEDVAQMYDGFLTGNSSEAMIGYIDSIFSGDIAQTTQSCSPVDFGSAASDTVQSALIACVPSLNVSTCVSEAFSASITPPCSACIDLTLQASYCDSICLTDSSTLECQTCLVNVGLSSLLTCLTTMVDMTPDYFSPATTQSACSPGDVDSLANLTDVPSIIACVQSASDPSSETSASSCFPANTTSTCTDCLSYAISSITSCSAVCGGDNEDACTACYDTIIATAADTCFPPPPPPCTTADSALYTSVVGDEILLTCNPLNATALEVDTCLAASALSTVSSSCMSCLSSVMPYYQYDDNVDCPLICASGGEECIPDPSCVAANSTKGIDAGPCFSSPPVRGSFDHEDDDTSQDDDEQISGPESSQEVNGTECSSGDVVVLQRLRTDMQTDCSATDGSLSQCLIAFNLTDVSKLSVTPTCMQCIDVEFGSVDESCLFECADDSAEECLPCLTGALSNATTACSSAATVTDATDVTKSGLGADGKAAATTAASLVGTCAAVVVAVMISLVM